jgi:uncharacterized protein YndB with AHSA1/START domain
VCKYSSRLPQPDLRCPEYSPKSIGWRVEKAVADLPTALVTGEYGKTPEGASTGTISTSLTIAATVEDVWNALKDIPTWHLWHHRVWNAIVREPGPIGEGSAINVRLKGGTEMTERIVEWDEHRRVVLRCDDAPFPLASYQATLTIERDGAATKLTMRMDYALRKSALVGVLARVGFDRAFEKEVRRDFSKLKSLMENKRSVGRLFTREVPPAPTTSKRALA